MLYGFDKTKNSSGAARTNSLFIEFFYDKPDDCIFTLDDEDKLLNGNHYASLSKLYLSMICSDPTEYTFAQTVFGSWKIWERIKTAPKVEPHYKRWKAEGEVKIKSEAIMAIATEMNEGGRSSFSAAKLLLERGWIEKSTATAKKRRIEEEKLNNEALQLLGEDAERLGLKVN